LSELFFASAVALGAGLLLLTATLMVWRHSLLASIWLLSIQGATLAALIAVIGLAAGEAELLVVAVLVLAIKGVLLPVIIARQSRATGRTEDDSLGLNPTAALLAVAGLSILAYVVFSRILTAQATAVTTHAAPIGLAMVLIGFLLLLTRRNARSQLVGFLLLDNGIATVAFLTSGGVPLILELGISLDVLLVVVILHVFTGRMRTKFGGTDVDSLRELHD